MIGRSAAISLSALAATACGVMPPDGASSPPLYVDIRPDGSLMVDGQTVDATEVRQRAGERTVFLRAEPTITYTEFQAVLRQLQGLNIPIAVVSEDAQQ